MPRSNAKASGQNQTLSIAPPPNSRNTQQQPAAKLPVHRLKVTIRMLPPGLSKEAFMDILGPEWELGQGKVEWFAFVPGKISENPSKSSRPSRAYLHLTSNDHLVHLADVVKESVFEDSHNTFGDKCLIGPPIAEFAIYGCKPSPIPHSDTIDQEPEFVAFLERMAKPKTGTHEKSVNIGTEHAKARKAPHVLCLGERKTTETKGIATKKAKKQGILSARANIGMKHERLTTPGVQYFRDKRTAETIETSAMYSKNQEIHNHRRSNGKTNYEHVKTAPFFHFLEKNAITVAKTSTKQELHSTKGKIVKDSTSLLEGSRRIRSGKKDKMLGRSGKEAAKLLNRNAPTKEISTSPKGATARQAQRGAVMAAHISMLHRDLGLSSAQAYRKTRREMTDAVVTSKVETASVGRATQHRMTKSHYSDRKRNT
ncbi:hypothetical protein K3495_g791 [Podosphaera aphanis]|nr:hypothetical protein K3495_g791 [Podosphaera aphanis]